MVHLLIIISNVWAGRSGVDVSHSSLSYSSIQEMWDVELHNKQPTNKLVNKIGSVFDWYNKANEYWSVS
jgi:hypothetical protein